jgi:hypothetical protein
MGTAQPLILSQRIPGGLWRFLRRLDGWKDGPRCDPQRRGLAPERGSRHGVVQAPSAPVRVALLVVVAPQARRATGRARLGFGVWGLILIGPPDEANEFLVKN